MKHCFLMTAALLLGAVPTAHAQATNGTLTLACRGVLESTRNNKTEKESISMGIVINFTAQTVEGFDSRAPTKITAIKQTIIEFSEFNGNNDSISGTIDR